MFVADVKCSQATGPWIARAKYAVFLADGRFVPQPPTNRLLVPAVKRSTVGSRAFPVAGPKTWNTLPEDVAYNTFRHQLTTWLFKKSSGHHRVILTES